MKQKWNSQCFETGQKCLISIFDRKSSKIKMLANFYKLKGILVNNGRGILKCKFLFQRVLTIFNAALYGGAVITTSLDYFVEHSVMLKWVWDRVCVKPSDPICWYSWAIAGAWPLAFILGEEALQNSFWRYFFLKRMKVGFWWTTLVCEHAKFYNFFHVII